MNGFAPVMIFLIGGLGFKSAMWVSDRWLGFADRWLGWWVWWPLLAPTGLMICVCVALLMVCVCVCVALLMVCVCVCGALCVEPVLEVEGERKEKKYC